MPDKINSFKHTWSIPLLLALLTMAGLLSALSGTGTWRILSWIVLSVPILVIAWCVLKQSGGRLPK